MLVWLILVDFQINYAFQNLTEHLTIEGGASAEYK